MKAPTEQDICINCGKKSDDLRLTYLGEEAVLICPDCPVEPLRAMIDLIEYATLERRAGRCEWCRRETWS